MIQEEYTKYFVNGHFKQRENSILNSIVIMKKFTILLLKFTNNIINLNFKKLQTMHFRQKKILDLFLSLYIMLPMIFFLLKPI
jgi:hypothetical protein